MKKYVVYIRVSTRRQGESGLGLESQQKICGEFIESDGGEKVAEFKDVESGTHRDRRGLSDAITYCKRNGCALVIAKLDRLARDVEFCFHVVNTGIEIHFCDMPQINSLLLGVFASVAQYERELTSDRTRKALAAKKERGEATGGACDAWRESYEAKSREKIKEEYIERGRMRNERYLKSRDVQVFIKVLRNVFKAACADADPSRWDWSSISTRGDFKDDMWNLMRDYKEMDDTGATFAKWDFDEPDAKKRQMKLAAYIQTLRKSVAYNNRGTKDVNGYE